MKVNKKRIWIAVLCVIVLVLCSYYFITRDKNKTDDQENQSQAQISIIQ